MKKLLLTFSMLMASVGAFAQYAHPIEMYGAGTMPLNESGQVVFSKVITAEGMTKDLIYQSARVFMVDLFNQPNQTIALDDAQRGIIIAKGISQQTTYNGFVDCTRDIRFTIKIQARDGRYRVEVYDLIGEMYANGMHLTEFAETCTDDKCLNTKGEIKPNGKAVWRRMMQDCAYKLIASAENKIKPIEIDSEEDW